jgi:predicted permease
MISSMLVALGVQLAEVKKLQITVDTFAATAVRLIGGPIIAALLVIPFGLTGVERSAGIIQAAMPAAVLTSIIALEHDIVPNFVTTTVLFSTLISLITLTLVLSWV